MQNYRKARFHLSLRVLIASSETPEQERVRRACAGAASHESYAQTLRRLDPSISIETVSCVIGKDLDQTINFDSFDGIFFSGSPIQMHVDTPETRSAASFMLRVFDACVPSFGSCAGLQIAAAAAGGKTGSRPPGIGVAFARNITATTAGQKHPMLRHRPLTWMAPATHSNIIKSLPRGAVVLARNPDTAVEAAEIRHGAGIFWGIQYHPELSLAEIGSSIHRQSDDLIDAGLVKDRKSLSTYVDQLSTLNDDAERNDIAWQLGIDEEAFRFSLRTREISNFLDFLHGRNPYR